MIKTNLSKETLQDNPDGEVFGVIRNGSIYSGYPITIIDNVNEIKDGVYTGYPATCLIHLSSEVRAYSKLRRHDDYLLLNRDRYDDSAEIAKLRKNREELTTKEIVAALKKVLYLLEPSLRSHTLVGTTKKGAENDPNFYTGNYVLNDDEEYTIFKHKGRYQFMRGKLSGWVNTDGDKFLIEEGDIDIAMYEKSLELESLHKYIAYNINTILKDETNDAIDRYKQLEKELNEYVNTLKV